MNKLVLIVGVIVLVAGLALLPFSGASSVSNKYDVKVQGNYGQPGTSWTISKNFNADDILGFDFRPGVDWSANSPDLYYPNFTGTRQPARVLDVTVTNPQSQDTEIRIWLIISKLGEGGTINVFPDYYQIYNKSLSDYEDLWTGEGYNDSSGAITMETGYPNVITLPNTTTWGGGSIYQLGKTTTHGVYSLSFYLDPDTKLQPGMNFSQESPTVFPPYSLVLSETSVETSYPYSWLLPVGIPASAVGVVTTGVGAKNKNKKSKLPARK